MSEAAVRRSRTSGNGEVLAAQGNTEARIQADSPGRVVELFAGVGGFRLGLEGHPGATRNDSWSVTWSNQWEPSTKAQHASDCYVGHFGPDGHVNDDIAKVWDQVPEHDLLVGGFPCQDYSVARTLNNATGIEGKKGVLWWQIHNILKARRPRFVFLENVDRLLKSPSTQRGRDFAIILACLSDLGYLVEWRVVNAAEYGAPQRRKRVFVVAEHLGTVALPNMLERMNSDGVLAKALPIIPDEELETIPSETVSFMIEGELSEISERFGTGKSKSSFMRAGIMCRREVSTREVVPALRQESRVLGDILQPDEEVDPSFFVPRSQVGRWKYLKGAKNEERQAKNGHQYIYSEGAIAYPDPLDKASRTILTGEGGSSPSRFKHIIKGPSGRLRRLTPVELERLNGFPDDWTKNGMPDGRRAFMMGNALVVPVVAAVGAELAKRMPSELPRRNRRLA